MTIRKPAKPRTAKQEVANLKRRKPRLDGLPPIYASVVTDLGYDPLSNGQT